MGASHTAQIHPAIEQHDPFNLASPTFTARRPLTAIFKAAVLLFVMMLAGACGGNADKVLAGENAPSLETASMPTNDESASWIATPRRTRGGDHGRRHDNIACSG